MTFLLILIVLLLFFIELDLSNISTSINDLRRSNEEKLSSISSSINNFAWKMQKKMEESAEADQGSTFKF